MIRLSALNFGASRAPIIFGWTFAAHSLGGALSALGTGLSRDVLSTYGPSFLVASMTCIVATIALVALRPVRPQVLAAE
jgi:hypothetical protein